MLSQTKLMASAVLLTFGVLIPTGLAQEKKAATLTPAKATKSDKKKLYAEFEKRMNNVKLVGKFTIVGRAADKLSKEEYTIRSVKKVGSGDIWAFATHIKYGNIDVPITLNLPVKWAGDTPVITLTNLKIPTLGTFSARVVLYNKKYAGTWTHGKVGGHLFGTIVRNKAKATTEKTGGQ